MGYHGGQNAKPTEFISIHGEVMLELLHALVHDTDFLWGGKLGTPALLFIAGKLICVSCAETIISDQKKCSKFHSLEFGSLYFAVFSYTLRMIAGERDSVASRRERSGWTSGTVDLLAYGGS